MSDFKERLKFLRSKKGLTQKEFAVVLGMSERGYQRYEQGAREPDIDGLILLARYFGVTTDYLIGLSDEEKRAK